MSDELKPCPCCGSASLETTENINESNNLGKCGAVWCECGLHMSARTLKEAMIAWNARAERTCEMVELDDVSWDEYAGVADGARRCSLCGALFIRNGDVPRPNYCPNCGAKVAG